VIPNFLAKAALETRRFFQARKVVSSLDALGLATLFRRRHGPVAVKSKLLKRRIWVRPRSSDWAVVMKVLSNREYSFETDNDFPAFIVDAGANIGMATLYFAWKYPAARIAAIEPEASNLEILRRNCEDIPSVRVCRSLERSLGLVHLKSNLREVDLLSRGNPILRRRSALRHDWRYSS
jgi:hypothetical protein